MSTPPTVIRISTGRLMANIRATLPPELSARRRVNADKDRFMPFIQVFSPITRSAVDRGCKAHTLDHPRLNQFG